MTIIEAGYKILVLLAISDKNYHAKEAKNIKTFLEKHFHEITDFRFMEIHEELVRLNYESRLEKLIEAAEVFKDSKSAKNKLRMVNYALNLIIIDRKITNEERLRFKVLGEFWDIDLERFINKKLGRV